MILFLAVNMVISQDQSLTSNPEICCQTCLTWQEMFQMGPKNPDAGMPPRNLPDKPGSFANAWEDSCPMRWRFGPKTCLVLFESTWLRDWREFWRSAFLGCTVPKLNMPISNGIRPKTTSHIKPIGQTRGRFWYSFAMAPQAMISIQTL